MQQAGIADTASRNLSRHHFISLIGPVNHELRIIAYYWTCLYGTMRDLIHAVNAERAKLKLAPLKVNDILSQTAEFYACRLIDGEFFSHTDPFDGSSVDSRASNFGYAFLKVGENLAEGQDTVEQV